MSKDPARPNPDDPKPDNIVSKKANEVTELDLWDMDFDLEPAPSPSENAPRPHGQLPAQRKSASKIRTRKPSDAKSKSAEVSELAEPPSPEAAEPQENEIPGETHDDVFADFPDLEETQPVEDTEETEDDTEETEDVTEEPKPEPIISSIGSWTKIEKIAITALCAALAFGAILTLIHFSNRVPTRPLVAKEVDFPVSGEIVEITAAETYWREPVTTGDNADVVRRDTKLIPVLKLNLSAKSGVIRVFFRNGEGLVVGDGITRAVKGAAEVAVAATAGFEDVGMHTAYRTGDGKRWIVQVFEGPSATAPREKFRKVLETEISTRVE